jgi:hypothetical protein
MLVQIDPIELGDAASPQLWNQRFGLITQALNGNIDSDNLKDGGVTTEKLADRSVTSAKLGFNKYVDANGWLITDLGLVKLATKERTFKTASTNPGTTSFVTFDPGMDTNPVGFSAAAPYNMQWAFSGDGNVGKWSLNLESGWAGNRAQPNSGVVQYQNFGAPEVRNFTMHTWVIF